MLKLAKLKEKLSNTIRLNFYYYLKIICVLHPYPRCHPKGDIPNNVQKTSRSV